MANSYNSNPILINTDIATGWRANQTLNTGNLPSTAQQYSGAVVRQPGIRPYRLQVLAAGAGSAAGTITITDPKDSTVLWQDAVVAAVATGTIIIDEDWDVTLPAWRDFIVTGVTATSTQLQIWYRA
jgi:hypothetical protein